MSLAGRHGGGAADRRRDWRSRRLLKLHRRDDLRKRRPFGGHLLSQRIYQFNCENSAVIFAW